MARTPSRAEDVPATLLEALAMALGAAARSGGGEMAPPAAVLWPDEGSEWTKVIPALLRRLPHLLILGSYDPSRRTGPAIWIKCVLSGTLPEPRLPPGAMPIVYLPAVGRQALRDGASAPRSSSPSSSSYLAGTRWARCATIKGRSRVQVPKVTWHWNPAVELAIAPGASCFTAGCEYAHGGASIQECLLQELKVTVSSEIVRAQAVVKEVQWFGLRCRVLVDASGASLRVDLRTRPLDPASSLISSPKPLEAGGKASLVVADEDQEGTAVVVVVLDSQERVVARQPTTVGGDR